MNEKVSTHYTADGALADKIASGLRDIGLEPGDLNAADLESIDEFHFRGRAATLELLEDMNLTATSNVLDIGSGLGGVARTIADDVGCRVTGIDLTEEFCNAATAISHWVKLDDKTDFQHCDATNLPFSDSQFDRAISVHVAMNIPHKDRMYQEARRVLKPGGIFAVYDILQGEGGDMLYPAPWAGDPSISYLATPHEMETLLSDAGFKIVKATDSTAASLGWLEARTTGSVSANPLPVTTQLLFGDTFRAMVSNQLIGLRERPDADLQLHLQDVKVMHRHPGLGVHSHGKSRTIKANRCMLFAACRRSLNRMLSIPTPTDLQKYRLGQTRRVSAYAPDRSCCQRRWSLAQSRFLVHQ